MKTKTYFASSVQAAMEVARRELGPDAMLVNSCPAPESARSFGRLEVTFAWDGGERREAGIDDLREEIAKLRSAICRQIPGVALDAEDEVVRRLCETGFERETAREIATAAAKRGGRPGDGVIAELAARLPVVPFAVPGQEKDDCRMLAFIGPSGRGKTSSLIKIAIRYGLAKKIPTRIYAAGAQGVGAVEQMARYAAILGVQFQSIESFEDLHRAISGAPRRGLILIDTPGAVMTDRQEMDAMGSFFAQHGEIERHLVLRAEARSADMQYMQSRFAAIQPTRLLFTGIDEVRGLGAAANTMIRSGIATTFFGTGPETPDDLEEVNATKLARSLWTANGLAARAA